MVALKVGNATPGEEPMFEYSLIPPGITGERSDSKLFCAEMNVNANFGAENDEDDGEISGLAIFMHHVVEYFIYYKCPTSYSTIRSL